MKAEGGQGDMKEESSKKKWLIESQIPNRAATLSNMTI